MEEEFTILDPEQSEGLLAAAMCTENDESCNVCKAHARAVNKALMRAGIILVHAKGLETMMDQAHAQLDATIQAGIDGLN